MAKTYGDRWEIVKSLRGGGQAETFLVIDKANAPSERHFVLKRVRNPERHGRFRTEVAALRSLDHPHVVKLLDADVEGEKPYLVMEYCAGGSMEDHPDRWQHDPVGALKLFAEVCDGVAAAHAVGVTHRDIKPANILLRGSDGPAVVGDFGIAFVADGERQTLTDEAVGARRFTAPELADGRAEDVSPRSDVYSLGKLLYWMLAGGRVFDREQHMDPRYDLARRDNGNPILEHVNRMLDKMIAADPRGRFADASAARNAARFAGDLLARNVRVLSRDLPQECAFCRFGRYVPVQMSDPTDVRNFGITPVATSQWRALVCEHCGNVQLFRPDHSAKRTWWGPDGGAPPVPR